MIKEARTENGVVRGLQGNDARIVSFKGIPFASPPVGNLRWRAPQPAKNWDGVLEAFKFAPISMQVPPGTLHNVYEREWNVDPEIPMSEDCLYLNIWTPAKTANEKLPVFVWYFGGGLVEGNTAEMEFNGERIARRGVVVVTVNYRVNCFGFLAHPEVTAEDPDFPSTFGNLDQKFGTEWAKRNIHAFGGNPDNITIGGQSAGGMSVMTQLTSPLTKGLFNKAIIMSGTMFGAYGEFGLGKARTLTEAEQDGIEFFEYLGVKSLEEARELDAFYIRDKFTEFAGLLEPPTVSRRRRWGPVIDNNYVVDSAMDLMQTGKRHMVPLMIGHTPPEFPAVPNYGSLEEFNAAIDKKFGDQVEAFRSIIGKGEWYDVQKAATFSPVELGVKTIFEHDLKNEETPDNYYYIFNGDIPGEDNPGAFHSVDLWFFFETLGVCWRPFMGNHYDLARQMCNYWGHFIASGNPNGIDSDGSKLPEWKSYQDAKAPMIFTDKCGMGDIANESPLMRFLVDYYTK